MFSTKTTCATVSSNSEGSTSLSLWIFLRAVNILRNLAEKTEEKTSSQRTHKIKELKYGRTTQIFFEDVRLQKVYNPTV